MRAASLKVTPFAMLSRSMAGVRGRMLIINLPGSPKGALENLEVVLPVLEHAVQLLTGESGGH
jgi:molybdopterin biosynthesis enzyme MoaB